MYKNIKLKKIIYVHYQQSILDGSNTHTMAFENSFSQICNKENIEFKVRSPKAHSKKPHDKTGLFSKLKSLMAKYYLKDFQILLSNYKKYKTEVSWLEQEKPDIVLTRFGRGNVSITWACRKLNIPFILEINSPDVETTTAHYKSFPFFNRLFSNNQALKHSIGAFTVSDYLTNQLKENSKQHRPIMTIPNGVDIEKFKPQIGKSLIREQFNIDKNATVIGYVGSFAPWHGIDIIAKSLPKLLDKNPNLHLLLVGQVQAQTGSLIHQLLNSQYKDKISMAGFVNLTEIPDYLAAMDITVLANTEDYCSPLKIFEYMAMGKAIVSVNTQAVCHIMRDQVDGLTFERNNIKEFNEKMLKLIQNKEIRVSLGDSARARVSQNYQWKDNAESIFNLIKQCDLAKQQD